MTIHVDSDEYRCWHEVGHATVCLSLGGGVDFIEFLVGDARGYARARCAVIPGTERSVACGGFAAEFYLLNHGLAERRPGDERNISQIIFHNATGDREAFFERKLERDEAFTEAEDKEFMSYAIGHDGHGGLISIFDRHFLEIQILARELCKTRRVEGSRIRELLRLGRSHQNCG